MTIDIGAVIRASGLPASTLHVWERHGIISASDRAGGRRQFPDDILDRIAVIVVLQRSGFQLLEIAELLAPDAFARERPDRFEREADTPESVWQKPRVWYRRG